MMKRLVCLSLFIAAGILSFLVNSAMFQAVVESRGPFETVEQSQSPLLLQVGEAFVGGLVLGLALVTAGWGAVRMRLLARLHGAGGYPLLVNLVLFSLLSLPAMILLVHLVFPQRAELGTAMRALLAIIGFVLLFVCSPAIKLLIVRRALGEQARVGLARLMLGAAFYWLPLLLTVYLGQSLVAEIGWAERIAAAEGPAIALAVWFLWAGNRMVGHALSV